MKKLTTEQIVKQFISVHGDKYDYSLVDYRNSKENVKIICRKHGEFEQIPSHHRDGRGCPSCGNIMKAESKMLSLEDTIKQFQELHGQTYDYSLVEYKGNTVNVKIKCRRHGVFEQTPNKHKSGQGCPKCVGFNLTTEDIIKQFNMTHKGLYDYSLVDYVDAKTKVKILCRNHGEFQQDVDSHRRGHGCPKCKAARASEILTLSQEDVINQFREVHGDTYDYSLVEYVKSNIKVKIICKIHGVFEQIPSSHKRGKGCIRCHHTHIKSLKTLSKEDTIKHFKVVHEDKYDYSLVDYTHSKDKVKILCNKHGVFEQTPNSHKNGNGCPKCMAENIAESKTLSLEDTIEHFKEVHGDVYDYSLVDYKSTEIKVKILCKKHGVFEQTPNSHKRGSGCPSCANGISKGQKALTEFLETISEVQTNYIYDKSTSRREVDCYLPKFNLAVEYEGLWWHSTKFREPNYHKQKRDELKAVGIDLIRIFEDEWLTKQEQVKNLLAMRLGKSSNKIYARQTRLEPISSEEAKDFYNLYHIQGQTRANGVSLCLKHEDKVVAVMTFTQNFSHRGLVQENLQELSRFASSIQVVGGASKLFKALIKLTKAEEVVSYSDNRLFTGKTYEALGFTKEHETRPDYYYIRDGVQERKHKSHFRHTNLPRMLGSIYNPELSERKNAENAGWYQLYNCGLTKWKYRI